ncbi:MAG: hypothetical protein EOO70_08665 [Myxococcaceae bacterium]|nr:MAG: hypothetical protein EOO70_08665 [Myxococcaceae bacterium]
MNDHVLLLAVLLVLGLIALVIVAVLAMVYGRAFRASCSARLGAHRGVSFNLDLPDPSRSPPPLAQSSRSVPDKHSS